MSRPTRYTPNTQHGAPKYTTQAMPDTPPPPYTPPRRPSLAGLAVRGPEMTHVNHRLLEGQHETRRISRRLSTTVTTTAGQDDDDEAAAAAMSPLQLHIDTSIRITKGNNLVCLTDSPARHASAIAEAVTQAIQRTSSGNCGLPMIDGDGNPRPIRIEVDAGMTVDGVGNVVGNEKIIEEVLRQRRELRRQEVRRQCADTTTAQEDEAGGSCSGSEHRAKRRRSE